MSETLHCAICGQPDGDMHNVEPRVTGTHKFTNVRPKYWLASDMIDWLKANTKLEDPEYAAKWWLGCQLAEAYRDFEERDWVELLVDGSEPLMLDAVSEYLQEHYQMQAEDDIEVFEADANLESEWCGFWEVKA